MLQAVLTFFGVILGATIAGGISLWQAKIVLQDQHEQRKEARKDRQTEREETQKDRQTQREETQKDARDVYQRDAILALEVAVEAYWQLIIELLDRVSGVTTEGRESPEERLFKLILKRNSRYGSLITARAHVFDHELRQLVEQVERGGLAMARLVGQVERGELEVARLVEQVERGELEVTKEEEWDTEMEAWRDGAKARHDVHERANLLLGKLY